VDSIHKPENFFMKVRDPASANSLAMSNEERWFLGTLFETLGAIEEWDGPLIHAAIDDVLSGSDLGRRQALDALYHVFIADESAGFCPQIGSILTRMGNEDLRAYRAAIGV
jgi:lysyl-tRNA synthetase class I